ncbi:MAG: hypothetical protein LBS29_05220 [Endomicrobium sp.]|jgi:broad specificity polyphosphatase/5'/3'-nucleotidase SurE|nr:hypothetical protein [Endomicrobium sp.]
MYKILVSNDDGINGPGLKPLIKELSKIAKVYVTKTSVVPPPRPPVTPAMPF